MARPTIFNTEIVEKTAEYLATWKELGDAIPSIAGLAVYLDITRETVYDWAKQEDKKEFSDIVSKIATKQELALINGSLNGKLNARISGMLLGKHGYSDKQDVTSNGETINVNILSYKDADNDTPPV